MSSTQKNEIPDNWVQTPLINILSKLSDGSHNPPKKSDVGFPMLSARNVENNFLNWSADYRLIKKDDFELEDKRTRVSAGDVLLTIVGTIGRACVVPTNTSKFTLQRSVAVLRALQIEPNFLCYQLQAPKTQNYLTYNSKGTAQKGIYLKALGEMPVLIAPKSQQIKIIKKIDELFSHIDAGVEGLNQAKVKLQQYRQSVLKDAVTGKLTEQWREQNADKLEPASALLDRILDERRANWEAEQLKAFEEKGKTPKNDKWKDKYKEPVLPNDGVETDFPTSWHVVSPDMIFASVTDGDHQAPPKVSDGIPFLVIGDVNTGEIKFGDKRFVPQEYYDAIKDERKPEKGDLLYTVVGSYGIPVKVETENPFCVQRHIAILKPSLEIIRDFYFHVFNSGFVYSQATAVATGTAQKTVSLGGLRSFKLPLPPITEQEKIAEIVAEKLNMAYKTEATVDAKIEHASFLKSSILAKAFSGELVPNTNGESAEELLDKIQLEKDLIVKTKPKRSTKRENIVTSERKPLLTVLNEQSEPVRPEELMQLAGFSSNEVEEFYIALAGIAEQVEQLLPSTSQKKNWPYEKESEFKLKLKD